MPTATAPPATTPVAARPDARRLRLATFALATGGFAIGTTEFLTMGLLPEVAHGVHVSIPHGGTLVSAYALGVVVGAPILTALGARRSRRGLLVALMLAYAVANLASSFAPTYATLLATRFVAGLPHGAYFGVAALVVADMAGPERRARAVASLLLGLSIANVVGVPAVTALGQHVGWRAAYGCSAALALLTAASVARVVPAAPADRTASFRRELGAFKRPQVLFAVAVASVGFGGTFAIYSYVSPILTGRADAPSGLVPVALALWGVGMVIGNRFGGWLVDRAGVARATYVAFAVMAVVFATFAFTSGSTVAALATMPFLGISMLLPTTLQVRLMDVAGDAQAVAASLNHSAFNLANAFGAWLGGAVLAAGWGLVAPMWVAVVLTGAGAALFTVALAVERRSALA